MCEYAESQRKKYRNILVLPQPCWAQGKRERQRNGEYIDSK